ncbi:hypothetical protein [Tepidibacter aestuarii]|uniref:hypothetical protein n=1 Tax=Tepidibacter aestuarii TaxID=2925782 RepID=UPI0020BED4B3|nr:hypothetical protein [Tepidibacter aestuarii]CAH2215295.1 conserved protein of unknown function [Tepidibacter aestuarii]
MKGFMSSQEYEAMKKRREESLKLKGQQKRDCECEEKLENLLKKSTRPKKTKTKNKGNDGFKNNYKNFEYDYEEDFYDPDLNRY